MEPTFEFDAPLWLHPGGSWVFLTVPEDESDVIRELAPHIGGFGSVRVRVEIDGHEWKTSVFPKKKAGPYDLPVKKEIRSKAGIDVGDTVAVTLTMLMG
ncbi:MAG: DUF1905 domain-containing protein [Acidimicrobiales bacterium]